MRTLLATALFLSALTPVAVVVATRQGEVISLVAKQDVPLFDPNTLAGKIGNRPTTIAVLHPGQSVPVVDCRDRKSDMDLVVVHEGKQLVAGGTSGSYALIRRTVSMREPGAISACVGLF